MCQSIKSITAIFLILNLAACQQKKDAELSMDDLTKGSERYGEESPIQEDKEQKIDSALRLSGLSNMLLDSLELDRTTIHLWDTLLFPDRFGALKTEKWYAKSAGDSLLFLSWKFKDSIKAKNALYNWFDCFGPKCKTVRVGQELSLGKRAVEIMLFEHYLILVESKKKLEPERWVQLFDRFGWKDELLMLMIQQPGKKTAWKKRNEAGELIDLEVEKP